MVEQLKSGEPEPKRRRSTRIVQAVPLTVTGEDALGQPFKERTSTLIVSCHGCRYQSKHYVPRNGSVDLEIQHPDPGRPARIVRARVSWIQRPRTVRELFQVGVELAVPGNLWGVAFPPDDWFPWPDAALPAIPGATSALKPAEAAQSVPPGPAEIEDTLPLEPAPAAHPAPHPPSDKVRTMPRPESHAEAPDSPSRQVQKIVAEARRQIQDDVKKIVTAVVTSESASITAAMTSQLRAGASEAVKQALMSHGQIHAERLDVALREALARLEIVRYESARAMKEQVETESKAVFGAASQAQQAAESALAQALARLESAREETARALSMQSRAEGQRVMAQAANRMEDLLRQSLGRIEEAGQSNSVRLTEAARAEMQQSVAGALEGLRADIASTSGEVRRLAGEELESARKQLEAVREQVSAAAKSAAADALSGLDAGMDTVRARLADLGREAGELDAAIAQKLGAGRGEWQEHVERELAAARGRWVELVEQTLAGSTESLRSRLQEASATAIAPALEKMMQQIDGQTAAAREALESVQAETGHAVGAMREAATETAGQAQRATSEAQKTFGELEAGMEARAAAARASVEALRIALDSGAAEARAKLETLRGGLEARAAGMHSALDAARGALEARAAELRAGVESVQGALDSRAEEMHRGLDAARGQLESRSAELHAGMESARGSLEERTAAMHGGLDALRATLEGESRRIESLLTTVREAHERVQSTLADLDSLRAAATRQIHDELDAGLRARSEELDHKARQAWQDLEARTAPALEAARNESLEKFRAALEEQIRARLQPELERVQETIDRLQSSEQHAEQVLVGFRDRLHDAAEAALRETSERLQNRVAQIEHEFADAGRKTTDGMLAQIEEKADDTTHKTFEALYKASEWYQKKAQTSLQSAMDRALEHSLSALREKAGEMSSLFASELDHYSRSYAEHTRGLLEETAVKVKEAARAEMEVNAEASRTLVTEETRRLAEQQIERAQRATDRAAGEVIARVVSQAHDAETVAADAAVRAVERVEEHAARTAERIEKQAAGTAEQMEKQARGTAEQIDERAANARDDMQALHANSAAAFAEKLAEEVADSLARAQAELDSTLAPILDRWRNERTEMQREWRENLATLGGTALEEHRDHLGNVANSLMATTVASLSEHSQTILDQLARDAEQRVRQSCAQAFTGLGEFLSQRLAAISGEIAPPPGPSSNKP